MKERVRQENEKIRLKMEEENAKRSALNVCSELNEKSDYDEY